MTLTEEKRARFTDRYARKDARTAIYTALFGCAGQDFAGGGNNDPFTDESRRLPQDFNYSHTESVFKSLVDMAQFVPKQKARLEERLAKLRHYKRSTT